MKKIISSMVSLVSALCILCLSVFPAFAAVTESEDNNSYSTANIINFGNTVSGALYDGDDKDFYRIDVSKKGYIKVDFENNIQEDSSGRWYLNVYRFTDESEKIHEHTINVTKSRTELPRIGVEKGTYYIELSGRYVEDINYSLTVNFTATEYWESELNNEYTVADKIEFGKQYGGYLYDAGKQDYYRIDVAKKGYIEIVFENALSTNTREKWYLTIYRLTDELDIIHEHSVLATKTKTELSKIGVEKGTYFIKISDGNVEDIEYRMTVNFTATEYWESELNNEYSVADKIEFGKQYGGYLYDAGKQDYYRIDVAKKGYIEIVFENALSTNTKEKWYLTIYRLTDELEIIHEHSVLATKTKTELPKIGVEKGTYFIKISDGYVEDIEYRMTVNFTATEYWESELNNEYTVADVIQMGKQYGGCINNPSQADFYKLNVSENGYIKITFENEISTNRRAKWYVTVYSFTNELQKICEYEASATKSGSELPKINVEKGTYYIKISDGYVENVEYRFTVSSGNTVLLGDVNLDGKVTASDARLVLRASVKLEALSAVQLNVADVDGKAGITAADARLILRASVGLEKL